MPCLAPSYCTGARPSACSLRHVLPLLCLRFGAPLRAPHSCPSLPLAPVPITSLVSALEQAQQAQRGVPAGMLADLLHALLEDVGAGMLRRGALLERQLLRTQDELERERAARQAAAETATQLRLELGLALREAAGNRAALRAAQEVVDSVPNAAAVQAAYRRAEQAEAEWSAALDLRDRYKVGVGRWGGMFG